MEVQSYGTHLSPCFSTKDVTVHCEVWPHAVYTHSAWGMRMALKRGNFRAPSYPRTHHRSDIMRFVVHHSSIVSTLFLFLRLLFVLLSKALIQKWQQIFWSEAFTWILSIIRLPLWVLVRRYLLFTQWNFFGWALIRKLLLLPHLDFLSEVLIRKWLLFLHLDFCGRLTKKW